VNNATTSADKAISNDPAIGEQEKVLQSTYEILCEGREAITRNLLARLSTEGFNDITGDDLLVLGTTVVDDLAPTMLQWLKITDQAASQSIERLIQRGYLQRPDNPGGPRQPTPAATELGARLLFEAQRAILVDRWDEFPFRSGDIVICTQPKSGTTWMQMICALLIFQTPSLPVNLQELSPWLDEDDVPRSEIFAKLAAQKHRRIIKTHTSLAEIPAAADPRVTYIVIARNPFDVAASWHSQQALLNPEQNKTTREEISDMIDKMRSPVMGGMTFFDGLLKIMSAAWEVRNHPNVILVHYEDLSADLAGEMRRLARRLDITVPEDKWPSLVQAATFKQMRADAEQLQPLAGQIKDPAAFFRRGSSGEGQALVTPDDAARYRTRAARVASQELLEWLHR
jgi:aryl sulfotransferase